MAIKSSAAIFSQQDISIKLKLLSEAKKYRTFVEHANKVQDAMNASNFLALISFALFF